MSDTEAAVIDTGAEVALPAGEVSREDLVKILEDARAADPDLDESAEAAPVEKPVEAPKVETEKVSARIIANKRAEMKAAAEREAIAKERAEIAAAKTESAEMAKQAEALKAAKLSPSKALEMLGMTPKEFLESLAGEHEPAAVAARASQGAMSEVEKLRAELTEMREAAVKREQDAARQQHDQAFNQATSAFMEHVEAAADRYPHLIAEYTPQELAHHARQAAIKHAAPYFKQFGEYPDNDTIAQYLEDQAAARAAVLAERRARVRSPASPLSQSNSAIQGQPLKAATPRTLTNGASSQKAAASKPWTQADADAESKRIIAQMHAEAND